MASGVTCADNIKDEFMKMKLKSKKEKNKDGQLNYKYMMFSLSDDKTQIVIRPEDCKEVNEEEDQRLHDDADQACWEEMVAKLQDAEPRYIVYDTHVTSKDGRQVEKLVFISWCSDNSPIKKKMVHAASEDTLKKSLEGVQGTTIQGHDKGDLEYEEIKKIALTRD